MRQFPLVSSLVVAVSLALATCALAAEPAPTPANSAAAYSPDEAAITASAAFLEGHPDMRWRLRGIEAERDGRYDDALNYYRRAARFADKPSQGLIGEMYWLGNGVAQDRATAYAWMDLAAERAYPFLLGKREHYWKAMDAGERERALEIGAALYAEFGDVAKPRLERVMRRERRNVTGSRTGFVGALTIQIPTPGGQRRIDAAHYYADKFWEPALYWRWQDHDWRKPGLGTVEVGDVMADDNEPAADAAAPGD
jgi:tetratricopeptide (TPR) repeat protein